MALDSVRVITNTATGQTGVILAQKLNKAGCKVTLLLGPVEEVPSLPSGIKLIRFRFFEELKCLLTRRLNIRSFDVVIHSAAVADFQPKTTIKKKISSSKINLLLRLSPTPKLIDGFRRQGEDLIIVGFKFEPNFSKSKLLQEARKLKYRAFLDSVVACRLQRGKYQAYIVEDQIRGPFVTRSEMANNLVRWIGEVLWRTSFCQRN